MKIPKGMKPWNGGSDAPADWDSEGPIMLATGLLYSVGETEGDVWWGRDYMRDGSLTGGCVIAYYPLPTSEEAGA